MEPENCPICKDGPMGFKFTRDWHINHQNIGNSTRGNGVQIEDLALHYNMTFKDVQEHLLHHELKVETIKVNNVDRTVVSSPDFYLNEFGFIYSTVKDILQRKINNDELEEDSIFVDQITKLTKEMNTTLTKLAEVQGRLKTGGDTETKILKVEGDLNIITDILSGGCLCPNCQEKVMQKLETVTHLLN
jgi:hypothetical protein